MILFRYREHSHLFRTQPCRERAFVLLDQPGQSSLIAAHGGAVDNIRTLLGAVLIHEAHVEPVG